MWAGGAADADRHEWADSTLLFLVFLALCHQISQRAALNIAVGAASMLLAVAAKHSPNDKRHKSCDDDSEQNGLDVHSRIYYNKV